MELSYLIPLATMDGIEITRTLAVPKLTLRLSGRVLGSPSP